MVRSSLFLTLSQHISFANSRESVNLYKLICMKAIFLFLFLSVFFLASINAQEKSYNISCVAFYNLENLFDTIDDPIKNDSEYLPDGLNAWGSVKYFNKLNRMAEVISQIGDEYIKGGPAVIGVSEVENASVLEDLVSKTVLKESGYKVILVEGPDLRGVDVALLYRASVFTPTNIKSYHLKIAGRDDFYTRDQLMVSGILNGDTIHFIVNHWPSRRGGEKRSAPLRNEAAKLSRSIVDSLLVLNPNARVIVMGDLNDNPTNSSVYNFLNAKGKLEELQSGQLYNPMYLLFKRDGIGTTAYRDSWSLFDQMIITPGLLPSNQTGLRMYKTLIFNRNFLVQKEGAFAGYPLRTMVGGSYLNGYSDHFPVYMFLIKEKN